MQEESVDETWPKCQLCARVRKRRGEEAGKHWMVAGDMVMMREPPSTIARQFADDGSNRRKLQLNCHSI